MNIILKVKGFIIEIIGSSLKYFDVRKKNVLFIVHNPLMFEYVEKTYLLLNKDLRINNQLCAIDEYWEDKKILKDIKKQKKYQWIPKMLASFYKWDLMIYPDHYRPFRKDCKKNYDGKKIFIGHGLYAGKSVDGESYEFGSRVLNNDGSCIYEKIFINSTYILEAVKEKYPQFIQTVRIVGSVFMDEVMDSCSEQEGSFFGGFNRNKKTILFSSTWGPYSLFYNCGLEILHQIKEITKKYNVIITIHFNNYSNNCGNKTDWQAELNKIKTLGISNIYVLKAGESPNTALCAADLMIADSSSLGLYYTQLKRPMIYYDNPNIKFNPYSLTLKLREAAYRIDSVTNLNNDIENAFSTFDPDKMNELADKINDYRGLGKIRYKEEIYESLGLEQLSGAS